MTLCTVHCPICKGFLARSTSKRGQPILRCGVCRFSILLLKKSTKEALDGVCQNIEESDLPPETLEKHRQSQQKQ